MDRNPSYIRRCLMSVVALRKESVDRNSTGLASLTVLTTVALRKESVDRNDAVQIVVVIMYASLSARRAWIEIWWLRCWQLAARESLSARRAWIEMFLSMGLDGRFKRRSPQGERG